MADRSKSYKLTGVSAEQYQYEHDARYPGNDWPPEAVAQHKKYKELTEKCDEVFHEYRDIALSYGAEENGYLEIPGPDGIDDPEGHRRLIQPAAKAAPLYQSHGDARRQFLVDRRYAYETLKQRERHEAHTEKAYRRALEFRGRERLHREQATALQTTPSRSRSRPRGTGRSLAVDPMEGPSSMQDTSFAAPSSDRHPYMGSLLTVPDNTPSSSRGRGRVRTNVSPVPSSRFPAPLPAPDGPTSFSLPPVRRSPRPLHANVFDAPASSSASASSFVPRSPHRPSLDVASTPGPRMPLRSTSPIPLIGRPGAYKNTSAIDPPRRGPSSTFSSSSRSHESSSRSHRTPIPSSSSSTMYDSRPRPSAPRRDLADSYVPSYRDSYEPHRSSRRRSDSPDVSYPPSSSRGRTPTSGGDYRRSSSRRRSTSRSRYDDGAF